MNKKNNKQGSWAKTIIRQSIFFAVIIFALIYAFGSIGDVNSEQEIETLANAITRSSIHCYVLEGAYPPDIEYMEENYGLNVDEDRFIVHYDIFATNIMPEITIIKKSNLIYNVE